MADIFLKSRCSSIEKNFNDRGLHHLRVLARGNHLVIYSEEGNEKINRARLTPLKGNTYVLGMADHRGKWESTPFTGTIQELIEMLTTQFSFALIESSAFGNEFRP